jgi:sugar (pentulose or hexulose) kinase
MEVQPVIAVFDIGKTNKKLFLFDATYHVLLERTANIAEIKDEDGFPCEDLEALKKFILGTLEEISSLAIYKIQALNFSAYGASLVYIDGNGQALTPLYNYLKEYPSTLSQLLYDRYGGRNEFSLTTASPALGSLNSGLQLFRIKIEQPEVFDRIQFALHLPQYLSYLLTGKACADITSIGCHTGLWDYTRQQYHVWLEAEGLEERLAPIGQGDAVTEAKPPYNFPVGIGLHDSSAALIPYLALCNEPFVLISTGTWCITLNPFNHTALTQEELSQDCLCYMTYDGNPVKASRLFAGYEHATQVSRIAAHFRTPEDKFKDLRFDPNLAERLRATRASSPAATRASSPAATRASSPAAVSAAPHQGIAFGALDLSLFQDDLQAYHQLMIDLVDAQVDATNRVLLPGTVGKLFVDGGFSKNDLFMNLLARAYPDMEVYASAVAQASALGAALALHQVWNQGPVPEHLIELRRYTANR